MSDDFKSILVTGANSGIGLTTAQYLASRGFHVYAGARNTATLEDLCKNINITPVQLDVTNTEDAINVKKIIEHRKPALFGLVNNAGITKAGPLMDAALEDLRSQFEVNLFGVHQITQVFFSLLLQAKGRMVMISSDSGFLPHRLSVLTVQANSRWKAIRIRCVVKSFPMV